MKALPALKKLDVSKNQIVELDDMPELLALEWLSLDENQIEKLDQLPKLRGLSCLSTLNLTANPLSDEKGDDIKKEVLIALDNLMIKFVNGEEGEVTQDDRDDAKAEKLERIRIAKEEEEEKQRLADEAAAAAAAGDGADAEQDD